MPSISALVLGLVQGLSEFLPVSSSAHLVLASELLDYQSPGLVLLITALALISVWRLRPQEEAGAELDIPWKVALLVGLAQGIAIFPGISRSGFTIVAGLWGGMGRRAAAEFSFLLSVPTIIAASLFEIWREPDLSGSDPQGLVIAGVVAFVTGLLAIHWLMRWLQRGRLWWFSGYCAIVGGLA